MTLSFTWGAFGCSSAAPSRFPDTGAGGSIGTTGTGSTTTGLMTGGGPTGGGTPEQPATCEAAAAVKSYVGCEFWPTVTYNPVYSVFDFAAAVANASDTPADVKVERNGTQIDAKTVAPKSLEKFYLPWVPELKGKDFDECTKGGRPVQSVRVDHGAYHLTSSVPITVWQFNPLEYKAGSGGAPGKNWACPHPPSACNGNGIDCLSVSNDASLLIPTAALTGNYRIFGKSGAKTTPWTPPGTADYERDSPASYAFTGTKDGTNVLIGLPMNGSVEGGPGVTAATGPGMMTFSLNAGDVVQLLGTRGKFYGDPNADLSGAVVVASQPIQIVATVAITNLPTPEVMSFGFADHLEETVLPAEVLGDHYIVAPPTSPQGKNVGHFIRFFGNFDGTALTYAGTPPPGAPTTLSAGQIVELPATMPGLPPSSLVTQAFEVAGTHSFAVASLMVGSQIQDSPMGDRGDPSMSFMVAEAEYRATYIFLAPSDYDVSFADIVAPPDAMMTLDGEALTAAPTAISPLWSIYRQQLGAGANGAHKLQSDKPVGLQVMGYGHATSYYYPGGLNLKPISIPPPPPK